MKLRTFFGICFALIAMLFSAHAFAAEFTYSVAVTPPSIPFGDLGYTNDGSFTVTITDDECSAGVYTVNATPVNNSAPDASTPPFTTVTTYIGFPEGGFFFGSAGMGDYTLTMTQTSANTGCNIGAQEITVVTVEIPAPVVTGGGKISSINNPPAVTAIVAPTTAETSDDDGMESTEEEMTEETDEVEEDDTTVQETEEVMYMEVCDSDTIAAYQAQLMEKSSSSTKNSYEEQLGRTLMQVKLFFNRYLDRAVDETEKNQKIMKLICKIEEVKKDRIDAEYTSLDYLLQYIQDLATLQFTK